MQPLKQKSTAVILSLLLGWLGIHWFYLEKYQRGIFYFLTFWTGIPLIASFFEAVYFIRLKDRDFFFKYNNH